MLRELLARVRRFLAPRARTWGLMVPLHLAAFAVLYFATARLVERQILAAATDLTQELLHHEGEELRLIAMQRVETAPRGHRLEELVDSHRGFGYRLYLPGGTALGNPAGFSMDDHLRMVEFLRSGERQRFWRDTENGRQHMRGFLRISAEDGCVSCHRAGATLAVAALDLDLTNRLAAVHGHARLYLALLIVAWAAILGVTTTLVKRSAQRSASRLEADLAAAEAGRDSAADTSELVLDSVSARLHRSLREFLRRHHERREAIAQRLAHTERLASLGQLAAGLAHEIKNPLAGIQGALEILLEDAPEESTRQLCSEMLGELKRVDETLKMLLASARPSPPRLTETNPRTLLEEVHRFLEPGLRRRNVQLEVEIADEVGSTRMDPDKIRQVLVNLVTNAAEAIDGSGSVRVRAGRFPDGTGLIVAVEDDGPGISPQAQARIFEPFFTTKFGGTGLGLAIARSLVEQHGGRLEMESEPGKGSSFYILLPAAGEEAEAADPPPAD